MSRYIKIFKDEGGDNNKLMSFRIDEAKLLKNCVCVYKTKIRTYGDNVYINVRDSNVPEDGVKWNLLLISIFESFVSHFY